MRDAILQWELSRPPIMAIKNSDASYRLIFSNPAMIRSLFEGVINEPWVGVLDWERLQALPSDYVGDTLGTATKALIEAAPAPLRPYVLRMEYLLVNERALVQSGTLPDNNLATLLFRLEHNRGIEDVQNLLQAVWDRTQGAEHGELRRAFTAWTKYVLLPRALPDVKIPQVGELLEIKDMLSDHSRSWTHQWKMEGKQEGRLEGQSMMLRRQLTSKFGPLPDAVQYRLQHAAPAQLNAWSLKILDAVSLDAVFDD